MIDAEKTNSQIFRIKYADNQHVVANRRHLHDLGSDLDRLFLVCVYFFLLVLCTSTGIGEWDSTLEA
jgi:hypothetical protein